MMNDKRNNKKYLSQSSLNLLNTLSIDAPLPIIVQAEELLSSAFPFWILLSPEHTAASKDSSQLILTYYQTYKYSVYTH